MIYLEEFFLALKKRIVHEKEAFFDMRPIGRYQLLSELNELTEPIISNTNTNVLVRKTVDKFSDDISFYRKDKYLAILKGKGLKDYDITKSFGEMIRRKIKITEEEKRSHEWTYSPQEIVEILDKGTLPEIYNTILYVVHGNM